VYLTINGNDNHFYGNWPWETADRNWISWAGQHIEDFVAAPVTVKGDVNGDGEVGIGDIISVTNFMANGDQSGITLEQADVNEDGQVGVGDIISITNIMAGDVAGQ